MSDRDDIGPTDASPLALHAVELESRSTRALQEVPARPVVVVLGMHRSGTSLLSNVLHILGVDMADTTDHVSPNNAGGFWERPELVAIHDEILEAIGRPIAKPSHVLPFPPAWWRAKEVQALKPKLVDYVRRELAKSASPWGFKDPRTCRLLPLWWEVFRELNLEPVYVNALRRPAEASVSMSQKSKVRKLSVANSEMMWLSYNYDIARFVTAKNPALMIDYDEWFVDPNAVAQRLCEVLGIGDDLSSEDIAECMATIVRGDYRHQVEGKEGVASGIPIAGMLYTAMTASNPLTPADLRALRGQLRLVDIFLKSLAPAALDLDAAATARAELHADLEATKALVTDRDATIEGLQSELETLACDRDAKIETLRQDHSEQLRHFESIRVELETAKELAGQASVLAESRSREYSVLAVKLNAQEQEIVRLEDEVSAARSEREAARREAEAAKSEVAAKNGELETVRAEADAAIAEIGATVRGELEISREETERLRGELEAAQKAADTLASQYGSIESRLARERARNRAVLQAAKRWRASYQAEHGESSARLGEAERLAAMHAELALAEQRLSEAQERKRRFVEELEARDISLAALRDGTERPREPKIETPVFRWPSEGDDALKVDGAIDRVGEAAFFGHVSVAGRPDVVPIIEVRVDGELALAQSCIADGLAGDETSDARWDFLVAWESIGPQHAGREAIIRVPGVQREIGRVTVPHDLRDFHLSPAARAAEIFGTTLAEAGEYLDWIRDHEVPAESEAARTYYADRRTSWPAITVIIYGSGGDNLRITLQSLRAQIFGYWEAICIDADAEVSEMDPRARAMSSTDAEAALSGFADEALITFIEAGDTLAATALLHLAEAARAHPDFALIYSDEDLIDARSGLRGAPHMKGSWSPDLALAQDYVARVALLRRQLVPQLPRGSTAVYDLAVRAALSASGRAIHLPFVLYHRAVGNAASDSARLDTVQDVVDSTPGYEGVKVEECADGRLKLSWPVPNPAPKVSLIVPTRDRVDLLRVCIDGFLHETRYANLEILIADNDSQETDTRNYLAKVSSHPRVRVIPCPGPFNYSKINNMAVDQATGALIGLMNNDLKVLDPNWLSEMVSHAVRPDIGIVGAKLLHGDDTIQHAGVTLGIGLASHLYKAFPSGAAGRNGRLVLPQDVSAVTAACLVMRRDVWDEVGGLDEEFPVAYNDVDLCLKVRDAGYRILWTPDALVYHLESQSRGKDVTPEKRERLNLDKERLIERWGSLLQADPFHSPNFSARHTDSRLSFPSRAKAPWRTLAAAQ